MTLNQLLKMLYNEIDFALDSYYLVDVDYKNFVFKSDTIGDILFLTKNPFQKAPLQQKLIFNKKLAKLLSKKYKLRLKDWAGDKYIGVKAKDLFKIINLKEDVDKWKRKLRNKTYLIKLIEEFLKGKTTWKDFVSNDNNKKSKRDFYEYAVTYSFHFPFKKLDPFIKDFNKFIKEAKK